MDTSQDEFDLDHQIIFELEDMALLLEDGVPRSTPAAPSRPSPATGTGAASSSGGLPSQVASVPRDGRAEDAQIAAIIVKVEPKDGLDDADAEILERAKRRRLLPGAATSDKDLRTHEELCFRMERHSWLVCGHLVMF